MRKVLWVALIGLFSFSSPGASQTQPSAATPLASEYSSPLEAMQVIALSAGVVGGLVVADIMTSGRLTGALFRRTSSVAARAVGQARPASLLGAAAARL
ncbi:exported hypothetical protein [Azospirillaceae bacterium]